MYLTKAFGNLVGLRDLQTFIATEVGLVAGHLLCLATHAELDKRLAGAEDLLRSCRARLGTASDALV